MQEWYKTLSTVDKERYVNFHNWAFREKEKGSVTGVATCRNQFRTITGQAVPIFIKWCWYIQYVLRSALAFQSSP